VAVLEPKYCKHANAQSLAEIQVKDSFLRPDIFDITYPGCKLSISIYGYSRERALEK
jgi:hypothetical protein